MRVDERTGWMRVDERTGWRRADERTGCRRVDERTGWRRVDKKLPEFPKFNCGVPSELQQKCLHPFTKANDAIGLQYELTLSGHQKELTSCVAA
jgi:hypothetical protein